MPVCSTPLNFNSSFLCWGENDHGELGLGEDSGRCGCPASEFRCAPCRAIRAQLVRGENHVCAITGEEGREEIRCYGAAHLVGNGMTRNEAGSVAIQWEGMPLRWNADHVPVVLE